MARLDDLFDQVETEAAPPSTLDGLFDQAETTPAPSRPRIPGIPFAGEEPPGQITVGPPPAMPAPRAAPTFQDRFAQASDIANTQNVRGLRTPPPEPEGFWQNLKTAVVPSLGHPPQEKPVILPGNGGSVMDDPQVGVLPMTPSTPFENIGDIFGAPTRALGTTLDPVLPWNAREEGQTWLEGMQDPSTGLARPAREALAGSIGRAWEKATDEERPYLSRVGNALLAELGGVGYLAASIPEDPTVLIPAVAATKPARAVSEVAGRGLERFGADQMNRVLKPGIPAERKGFDVQTVFNEDIGGNPKQVYEKSRAKIQELSTELKKRIQAGADEGHRVDLNRLIDEALADVRQNPGGSADNVAMQEDLEKQIARVKARARKISKAGKRQDGVLDLAEAQAFKQDLGHRGAWRHIAERRGIPLSSRESNESRISEMIYHRLNDAIDEGAPAGVRDINQRLSQLIPVNQAAGHRAVIEGRNNLSSMSDMLSAVATAANPKMWPMFGITRAGKSGNVANAIYKLGAKLRTAKTSAEKARYIAALKKLGLSDEEIAAGMKVVDEAGADYNMRVQDAGPGSSSPPAQAAPPAPVPRPAPTGPRVPTSESHRVKVPEFEGLSSPINPPAPAYDPLEDMNPLRRKMAQNAPERRPVGQGVEDMAPVPRYEQQVTQGLRDAVPDVREGEPLFQTAEGAGVPEGKATPKVKAAAAKAWREKGTESPFFKRWFKDSKVVDKDGKPLVVYHGTGEKGLSGNQFKKEYLGSSTKSRSAKEGFFFVNEEETARGYASLANDKPVSDLIELSQRLERQGKWKEANQAMARAEKLEQGAKKKENVVSAYLTAKNPYEFNADGQRFLDIQDEIHQAIKEAKNGGHDAVVFRDLVDNADWGSGRPADHWMVFEPEQVKSATRNKGTFDPADPSILHQEGAPNAPTFYSKLSQTIREKMPNSADPQTLRGLLKGAGVKDEEVKWADVDGFLAGKAKVSKQELTDYLDQNKVEIKEVVKGDGAFDRTFVDQGDDGRWYLFGERANESDVYATAEDIKRAYGVNTDGGTYQVLPITDAMRKSVLEKGQELFQKPARNVQGTYNTKNGLITLFKGRADVTTWMHENGHKFRLELLTPEQSANVLRWTGQKTWTREAEEKFARGWERYLYDGVAPTKALREPFGVLKDSFRKAYRELGSSSIREDVPAAVREVYDAVLLRGQKARNAEKLRKLMAAGRRAGLSSPRIVSLVKQQFGDSANADKRGP